MESLSLMITTLDNSLPEVFFELFRVNFPPKIRFWASVIFDVYSSARIESI